MKSFFAMLSRIKYINRWGLMRSSRNESLGEHTLETAMLTHALVSIANRRLNANLDIGQAVLFAMYHDACEIITGDMPTPVKYQNSQIINVYKDIELQANQRLLAMLPSDLKEDFSSYFLEEEPSPYAPFVKAADKLSAVIKCTEELKGGNLEFRQALETCLAHPSLQLEAAKIFINEFLPAYSLTLDEL